jgi:hypothetical protein
MDTVGNKGAHTELQVIKNAAPSTAEWILDKAIQSAWRRRDEPPHGAGPGRALE